MPFVHIKLGEKEQRLQLTFNTREKLTWELLVDSIINSSSTSFIDLPITLYYKINNNIQLLESDTQLQTLLTQNKNDYPMYLFGTEELVNKPVFEQQHPSSPPPTISVFARLGQLTNTHKQIISSSRHLSRCVGILASAIALDTNNKEFDKEFKALEKVIETRRKEDIESTVQGSKNEKTLATTNQESKDNTQRNDNCRGRRGVRRRGFGEVSEDRPRHHDDPEFSCSRGDFVGGGRGGHNRHYHHHHHHHHGSREPVADFFSALASDENMRNRKHKKAQECFRGRGRELSSSEDSSSEDMEALVSKIKNAHIQEYNDNKRRHHPHRHHQGGRRTRGGGGRNPFAEFDFL